MTVLSSVLEEVKILSSDDRGKALAVISGGWFLAIGTQMIYPVLLPQLRAAYGLDLTMAGLLLTTIWLSQAVSQVPAGALTDRIGGHPALAASMLICAGALAVVVAGGTALPLFGATALFGVGLALFGIARFTVIQELYPNRIGTSSGVIMAAADAGQTVLPPVASSIALVAVWQYGFAVTIPFFVLSAGLLWVAVPASAVRSGDDRRVPSTVRIRYLLSELRRPSVTRGTLVLILYGTVWAAFTGFYPTYIVEVKGFSTAIASVLFGLFFGLGIVVKPLAGSAYDRIGIRRALLSVVAVPTLAFAVLPFVDSLVGLVAVTALAAPLLGSGAIVQPYVLETLPEDLKGTGLATVRTIFLTVGAIAPVVFGTIADRGFFDEIYFVLALLTGVNVLIVTRMADMEPP